MAVTKLGSHFLLGPPPDEVRPLMSRWQPAVVKSVGDVNYLSLISDVMPDTLLIHRFLWDGPGGGHNDFPAWYDTYGEKSVEDWLSRFGRELTAIQGNPRMFVESFNETTLSDSYLRFEAERTHQLYQRYGLRSVVINPGVGTTGDSDWYRARDAGLLDAVRNTGSLVGLHAYAGLFMTLWHGSQNLGVPGNGNRLKDAPKNLVYRSIIPPDDPDSLESWLAFRARRDHETLKFLGYGDVRFVLTEFGFDNAGVETYLSYTNNTPRGGWRTWVEDWRNLGFLENTAAPYFYADQLLWADKQFLAYPFIAGATIYSYNAEAANRNWYDYDITGTVSEAFVHKVLSGQPPRTRVWEPEELLGIAAEEEVAAPPPPTYEGPVIIEIPPPPEPTVAPGPGSVHGTPDYHFLMLPTHNESEWFFQITGARHYWNQFLPTILTDIEFIQFIPGTLSLMITIITTSDMREIVENRILIRWPNVELDFIIVQSAAELDEILNTRVTTNLPFGD